MIRTSSNKYPPQKVFKIGKCTFKKQNTFFRQYLTSSIIKKMQQNQLQISRGTYYKNFWNIIFQQMVRTEIYQLKIQHLQNSQYTPKQNPLIKTLSYVSFSNLKRLSLYKASIESIQALAFIYAPNLQNLNLIYNHITSYKCLRKCFFRIKNLYIYSQSLEQPNLDVLCFSDLQLTDLRIQFDQQSSILCQNLSMFTKLPRKHTYHRDQRKRDINIKLLADNRILQPKLHDKLKTQFIHNVHFEVKKPITRRVVIVRQNQIHAQDEYENYDDYDHFEYDTFPEFLWRFFGLHRYRPFRY